MTTLADVLYKEMRKPMVVYDAPQMPEDLKVAEESEADKFKE